MASIFWPNPPFFETFVCVLAARRSKAFLGIGQPSPLVVEIDLVIQDFVARKHRRRAELTKSPSPRRSQCVKELTKCDITLEIKEIIAREPIRNCDFDGLFLNDLVLFFHTIDAVTAHFTIGSISK